MAVQPPPYFSHAAWLHGFEAFTAHLKVRSRTCHIYGDGLGCFLALLYAQRHPRRVASLVLCNGYCSTTSLGFGERLLGGAWFGGAVVQAGGAVFKLVPEFMYKRLLLAQLPQGLLPAEMAEAVDFAVREIRARYARDMREIAYARSSIRAK